LRGAPPPSGAEKTTPGAIRRAKPRHSRPLFGRGAAEKYAAAPFGLCGGKILVVVFFGLPERGSGVGRFSIA